MNYVLFSGPQEGPHALVGAYSTEGELMAAVEKEENSGLFCLAYSLENPHYDTEG